MADSKLSALTQLPDVNFDDTNEMYIIRNGIALEYKTTLAKLRSEYLNDYYVAMPGGIGANAMINIQGGVFADADITFDAATKTVGWSTGDYTFQHNVTNNDTVVMLKGNGTGIGDLRTYDEDDAEYLQMSAVAGKGYLNTAGASPSDLVLQDAAHADVSLFESAAAGETPSLNITGYRTADASRTLSITVGASVADQVDFTGLSTYYFDNEVKIGVYTLPATDGTIGQALITDGAGAVAWAEAGTGDVVGPGSSTDNAIARFHLTTGKIIQNSGATIDDSDNLTTAGYVRAAAPTDPLDAVNLATLSLHQGTFVESFNALVTSDGAIITLSLEKSGTGDLTMHFSDGYTTLDCTPADTIALTAGTIAVPQENYIYVLQSTKVLTKSTTQWPAAEHIKVGYFYVQTAAYIAADGALINQNWNDEYANTDLMGHITDIGLWIRRHGGANWFSGVDPAGIDDYITVVTNVGTPDNVFFKSGSGVIAQMHTHTYDALDMSGADNAHVVNDSATAFLAVTDLNGLLTDSAGGSMSGKYFNLVFAGVANKTGEYSPLMVLLPSGSYNNATGATLDTSGYTTFALPREFTRDSSTGFLICRVTLKHSASSGGTWTVIATQNLRGTDGVTASGSGGTNTVTSFNDSLFEIYNNADSTKLINFDASGITTATTRTYTGPDADGTLVLGPGTVSDNAVARWNGTGSLLQNSGVLIDDSNNVTLNDIHPLTDTLEITNVLANNDTTVSIFGTGGVGKGNIRIYGVGGVENVLMYSATGVGYIRTEGSSPVELHLQDTAHADIRCFGNAAEGETKELIVYGYRTGDTRRFMQIGVGVDAIDTASFDGVGNYLFDGIVQCDSIVISGAFPVDYIISTSPSPLHLQNTAHEDIRCFADAASGETKELIIYGYRAADSKRFMQIGVGVDAVDTASFDGVSYYLFDGDIQADSLSLINPLEVSSILYVTELHLQKSANADVRCFADAASGETKEFVIYGYRTADSKRFMQIGVGIDAADTASFDGLSFYLFDGIVDSDSYKVAGTQVVGAQGAAVSVDATDLASALTLVNELKARLEAHGLVA